MKIFPNKGRPESLWIMTVVTIGYLLVEFSFNSRLLDALGGISAATNIDGIEKWGRCISGFAAALMLWPFILNANISGIIKTILILFITIVVVVFVYMGEKYLVDSIVDNSTAKQRYAAENLILLQQTITTNDAEISGLSLSKNQLTAPDGKAFLATFPYMLMSIKDITEKIKNQKSALVRNLADKSYGGLDKNFNLYVDSLKFLEDSYNSNYLRASRSYSDAINNIGTQQSQAWDRYLSRLRKHSMLPDSVPRIYYKRIRQDVQSSGVPVSREWVPYDRNGFYQAVARKVHAETESKYREEIIQDSGIYIPPNLTPTEYFSNSGIQRLWTIKLKYPHEVMLRPDIKNPKQFNQEVYTRVLDIRVREQLQILDAPVTSYENYGQLYEDGLHSMRALVAPPLALAFSVLGAVVHLFKTFFFLIQCLTGRGWANPLIKTGAILVSMTGMFWVFSNILSNNITNQDIYNNYIYTNTTSMFSGKPDIQGYVVANAIRGTIHVQPYVYPIFESIRTTLLSDAEFGFHG